MLLFPNQPVILMKSVNIRPEKADNPDILSISADGEIKVWNLEMTLQTFSANKNIAKAKVIQGFNAQVPTYFIILLSDDGFVLVYKFDAMGITKVGYAQTWVDHIQGKNIPRIADFELVTDNGKSALILVEKTGRLRAYELE
jgi:hypothetical protein